MSILNFRLNIILLLFFWSQAIPILASMLGTSQSADDEVGITVQWLPSGDATTTVDTMVYPHLSNTLQEVLNMVHEEHERILGRPPVPEEFAGIHLVVLMSRPVVQRIDSDDDVQTQDS